MALLNLSLVTRSYITLLSNAIPAYTHDWPSSSTKLTVSAGPPDVVVQDDYALSFYLYHVREDAHTKSQDWQVNEPVPQRYKPMGLTLYYVMTPRSNITEENERALADQLIMGLALKTMHDMPVIDDNSVVIVPSAKPVKVMEPTLQGLNNRFRAVLQPTAANEAVQYWQAGTQAPRLAAYYEVAATLLEPVEPPSRRGRVLMAGVHTFLRGEPRIDSTANTITFTPPGALNPREQEISPAEVPYGQTLEVRGANLKGDKTALLLSHRDFAEPLPVDTPWNLRTDGSVLTVTVQQQIGTKALLPGIYGAIVRTTARHTMPDGTQRDFDTFSNTSGFAIAPAILSVTAATPILTITVNGFDTSSDKLSGDNIQLFAGTVRLERKKTSPANPGEFFTPGPPPSSPPGTPSNVIEFCFPAGTLPGSTPLRLVVRGVESGPWWETVP